MFQSSTIIRKPALNLGYFYVKTFGEIRSLFIVRLCGSMSGIACALCAVNSA